MQLDHQLTMFDSPFTNQIRYNTLDSDGKIYYKIDWLTVMFFDVTMNDILHWLQLDDAVNDFLLGMYEQARGFDNIFNFSFNGVKLETKSDHFYGSELGLGIFDTLLPKIRCEISGAGLDYLRQRGIDVESFVKAPIELRGPGQYHFTRCDHAFDLINYCPDFLDNMIDCINKNVLPSGRVPVLNLPGGISCKLVTCGQKTVYLGSPQSDRMLRVYDKRLEQSDLRTMTYKKPNPYGDPDSWIRLEWQTRNKFATQLLVGTDASGKMHDAKTIFRQLFERYAFAEGLDGDLHRNHIKPVDFWQQLFNWEDVEQRIIQNQKYVECVDPHQEVIDRFRSVSMRSFILYYSIVGPEGLLRDANAYLKRLYDSTPESARRYYAFLNQLNRLPNYQLPQDALPGVGLYNNSGRFGFKL